jgi:type II secretory pathway component PulK
MGAATPPLLRRGISLTHTFTGFATSPSCSPGFALITVLFVVMIVSAVALTLASTMRVQARLAAGDRAGLAAEQMCAAGHDLAFYLQQRGLGTVQEKLDGLPVKAVSPGLHYVLSFPNGNVDLYLEAEDGKLNLSLAPVELLERFFTLWSGDAALGRNLALAVEDWRDLNEQPEPGGAEGEYYLPAGYLPRNAALGIGDVALLRGLSAEDFRDRLEGQPDATRRRPGLMNFVTTAPTGATVNPFFAPELVLRSIPGLDEDAVRRIVSERKAGLFKDASDFAVRIGLPEDSPSRPYLHFTRKVPALLTIATSEDGSILRSDRRVIYPFPKLNPLTGSFDADSAVGLRERNVWPEFLGGLTR